LQLQATERCIRHHIFGLRLHLISMKIRRLILPAEL
jgi:hypothetical protein